MKPILFRELHDRRFSLLAYCGIVLALALIYISIFPSLKASLSQFQKLYESYPKGLYKALGIENFSISTIENFLAIELYSIVWPILALLFSSALAGNAVSGQIERRTIGLYLSLPVSRSKIFAAKYFAGIINIGVFVVVSVLGVLPLAELFHNPASVPHFMILSILSLLFMLAVFSASMFLSAIFSERSKVYMVVGGSLILMYAANVIAGLKSDLSWLSTYSIFHYYDASNVLASGRLKTASVLIFSISAALFTALGVWIFRKRDMSV